MIIYHDLEKELSLHDYRPLNTPKGLSIDELNELLNNLEMAAEKAWIDGNDLFLMAINPDVQKVKMYIKMAKKKQERKGE